MTTYVMRGDKLVEKKEAPNRGLSLMPDITPFVTTEGVAIGSRSTLRAYEQSRGIRQIGNDWSRPQPSQRRD